MKPNESPAGDDADWFRTTHWSGVSLLVQIQVPDSRTASANLCRPYTDPRAADREIHALCEALVASEDRLGP
jgi:hypothetical protein